MSVPPVANDEDDFESFDLMGVDDIDSPAHEDDMIVDLTLIPAMTEPCPNPECSADAAVIYAVDLLREFRQCVDGCGIFMVLE